MCKNKKLRKVLEISCYWIVLLVLIILFLLIYYNIITGQLPFIILAVVAIAWSRFPEGKTPSIIR